MYFKKLHEDEDMKAWDDVLIDAKLLFDFLGREKFFDAPYNGTTSGRKVFTDPAPCFEFAQNQSGDGFEDWQTLLDNATLDFEVGYSGFIRKKITKALGDGLYQKDFSGADLKFSRLPGISLLFNNMEGDMERLFYCYLNGKFPPIWEQVLDVYLYNGYPCGWIGRYPEGELVVFSNF
jgi:hypothetical protein